MGKWFSLVKFIFGWPLSLLACYFLYRQFIPHAADFWDKLRHADVFLLILGVVSFFLYFFFRAYVWQQLLLHQRQSVPLAQTAHLWSQAEIRRYIPGSIFSFASRAVLFGRHKIPKEVVGKSLLYEAELIVLSCALLSLFGLSLLPLPSGLVQTIIVAVLGASLVWIVAPYLHTLSKKLPMLSHVSFLIPSFPAQQQLVLLGLSVASFFFLGLGTYFSILSIVYLSPDSWLQLVGVFLAAVLAGYVTLIAPSGLGVREGIIALGLLPIVGVTAAPAALFSRLVVTLAEVVFLIIAFYARKLRSTTFFATRKGSIIVLFLTLAYVLYFTAASFARHDTFYSGRFDLGNMDQTVWNSSQGRLFQFTNPDGTEIISRFAFHADVILVLLAPFYWIAATPKTILFAQTLVLASGALFVYLLAKRILQHESFAVILAFVYLINPSVQHTNLYDFHAVTFATTFLMASYYFLERRKQVLFFLFLILAAFSKEQIWVIVGLLALFAAIRTPWKVTGALFALCSFGLFYFLVWHVIPDARGGHHFAVEFYSHLGDSPTAIVRSIVLSPHKTIATLFQQDRIEYMKALLIPVGYFPLASPCMLFFTGPDMLINLMSSNHQFRQLYYQYTAGITPFLFITTIYGIATLRRLFPRGPLVYLQLFLLGMAIYGAYKYGPLPGAKAPNTDMFTKALPYRYEVKEALYAIPTAARVAATNNIGAHLTHREYLYTIPQGLSQADYVVFLLTQNATSKELETLARTLKTNGKYRVVKEKEALLILKKK